MNETDLFLFIGIIGLLALDLTTSATLSGFLHLNLARLLGLREGREAQVNRTHRLFNNIVRVKAGLDLTQTIFRFLIAGLALLLFMPWESASHLILSAALVLILTSLVIFWLEWLIEWQVEKSSETWALRLTPYANFLMTILNPFLAPPLFLSRKSGGENESTLSVTEDELMSLMEAGQQEGVFEQDERQMIVSIFKLGDTLAREIMVPRIDIMALEINTSLPEALDVFLKSGFSRLPVYHETIDNIRGLLYAKDLLSIWREDSQLVTLETLLRPAYFIPETKKVDELLAEMQVQRIHMGIVVDEYGGIAGLVTLEDIVEEIVGEIQDEYDQGEELPYQTISDSEYIFQGRIDLDDFNEVMACELPKEEADTLGGYIYSRIGRVPSGGETIAFHDLQLTVEQISGRRIRKVRVKRIPQASQAEEKTE